jgi:hypothetical protein
MSMSAGVVAWAVSAEVVMGAHRESAMKASEAFRLSQVSSAHCITLHCQQVDLLTSRPIAFIRHVWHEEMSEVIRKKGRLK